MTAKWLNATGDVVPGDVIRFTEAVFGGTPWKPRYLGEREIIARVLRDSYGRDRGQHTFTLEVVSSTGTEALAAGTVTQRKGRNVYRNGTERRRWDDEAARDRIAAEKHARGDKARAKRFLGQWPEGPQAPS